MKTAGIDPYEDEHRHRLLSGQKADRWGPTPVLWDEIPKHDDGIHPLPQPVVPTGRTLRGRVTYYGLLHDAPDDSWIRFADVETWTPQKASWPGFMWSYRVEFLPPEGWTPAAVAGSSPEAPAVTP